MKDKANKGYWQRLAKIYAPLMESDKKFYNAICGYIRDYLKSDMNVLELACGTGQLSFPLSDCTNSWTATDFSENMIKQAKRRGTTEKLSFCVADATALSYENENFDCVVISNALHIMPEPEKAMQEIRRVLKKDGILYAPTFLWAEKKSSGLRKRLMSITGFKAYKEWKVEFSDFFNAVSAKYQSVYIVANSIGAFFTMNALADRNIEKAFFISPIVNMEKLIADMMIWANVTEQDLYKEKEIETSFGETLSWEYLCYVREHPVVWNIPTKILYGDKDNLTSYETMSDFASKMGISLTVMNNGEHWFHTDEQMNFLDDWICESNR